jgi:hypothetical protein
MCQAAVSGAEPVRLRHIADALEKASREMLDRGEPISRVISAKPETCPECSWLPNAAARQPAHSVTVHRAKKYNVGSVSKKERMWIWRLQFKHGMQAEDWTAMLNAQQGLCYLCGEEFGSRKIVIEHDHSCCPAEESCSACRRGLACSNCNSVIGLAGDDYARLRIMADVLEAAKEAVEQRKSDAAIAASLPRPRRRAASRPGKRGERVEPPAGPQASPGLRS